mmetsp:Transcript_13311/g.31513  ORF Transcript_13311/g.31513 Transcript_13311/m.31513 type:complete len:273 (+) Transcript_13311:538-1356(+)
MVDAAAVPVVPLLVEVPRKGRCHAGARGDHIQHLLEVPEEGHARGAARMEGHVREDDHPLPLPGGFLALQGEPPQLRLAHAAVEPHEAHVRAREPARAVLVLVGVPLVEEPGCKPGVRVGRLPSQEANVVRVQDHKSPSSVRAEAVVAPATRRLRDPQPLVQVWPCQVVQTVVAENVIGFLVERCKFLHHCLQRFDGLVPGETINDVTQVKPELGTIGIPAKNCTPKTTECVAVVPNSTHETHSVRYIGILHIGAHTESALEIVWAWCFNSK